VTPAIVAAARSRPAIFRGRRMVSLRREGPECPFRAHHGAAR
jgi:hypothetical protein